MSTYVPTAGRIERRWHVIDAAEHPVGRVASLAAHLLQGKHKGIYTPYIDTGDHVVVVNAAKTKLTGRKEEQKMYRYHSGYDGGLRGVACAKSAPRTCARSTRAAWSRRPCAACCPSRRWAMRCTAS
jgi:large subunit ribosomal protein L13